MAYLKSPMNYIGNKYRLLRQIIPLLPPSARFVDLFAGGLDVAINYSSKKKTICNDINVHLIDIYRAFQGHTYVDLMEYFISKIDEYSLSKSNEEGYQRFRDYYNHSDRNPLDLYLLMNYGFNYQLRFNADHEFNNPFGRERSSFNSAIRKRLKPFLERIKDFEFTCAEFRSFDYDRLERGDLVYCDPPYTISTGSYNDGKRGFNGWHEADDDALTEILDSLSERGVNFALSDVLVHKGLENAILKKWSDKYIVHNIISCYNNCNYHAANKRSDTREVLITNVQNVWLDTGFSFV